MIQSDSYGENVDMEDKIKTPYERVMLARDKDRLKITDYIDALFDDFIELKGDGIAGEDSAILGGIASFHGIPVTVIGHKKGGSTEENIDCNFGMASPEGYRKAARLMKQAEKFNRPVITIVDTPGAYPALQVSPAPKPTKTIFIPLFISPLSNKSSMASPTLAAEVLA